MKVQMAFCQTLVARSKKMIALDYSNSLDIVLYQQVLERLTLSDLSNHLRSYLIAIYHQPIPPTQPGHVGREARLGQVEGQMRCNYFEPKVAKVAKPSTNVALCLIHLSQIDVDHPNWG